MRFSATVNEPTNPSCCTVLGDVADAVGQALPGALSADVLSLERHPAGGRRHQPEQGLDQLGLAVPLYAGDAEDLPASHVERDTVDHGVPAVVDHGEVVDHQDDVVGCPVGLVDGELDRSADHQLCQLGLAGGLRCRRGDDRATADHGDPVRDGDHLFELVRDEDDGRPVVAQGSHDADQLVDLLRGQHRGGLVENQDLGVVGECLDDLDTLLHSHRDVLDDRFGVDGEPVPFGHLMHEVSRLVPVENAQTAGRLAAEHDVLGDGEDRHQHEVLVHHPDPGGDGVAGAR